jgi:hypothetical protein
MATAEAARVSYYPTTARALIQAARERNTLLS